MVSKKFGKWLRKVRRSTEMTQRELSKTSGVSVSFICEIEKHGNALSLKHAEALVRGVGYKLSDAIKEIEQQELSKQ